MLRKTNPLTQLLFRAAVRHTLATAAIGAVVSPFLPDTDTAGVSTSTPVVEVAPKAAPTAAEALAVGPTLGVGEASFYGHGDGFAGRRTANGETFDPNALTAAHPSLPLGTRIRVTNLANLRSVVVRINDRGPYAHGRILDLSYAAAKHLGMVHQGHTHVRLEGMG